MSLGNVVLLGGFGGSNLDREETFFLPPFRYWVSFPPVLGQGWPYLQLADDGVTPFLAFSGVITADEQFGFFYAAIRNQLQRDWTVKPIGYDFRLSSQVTAATVLARINASFPNQDYNIVAHSHGGIVARLLWRLAGIAGTQSRIKRIVTLGTPHWGSYSAVDVMLRRGESYRLLDLGTAIALTVQLARVGDFFRGQSQAHLDRVLCSWPGLYEQLPQITAPSATLDVNRGKLFDPFVWNPINEFVTDQQLQRALSTHTLLRNPSTQPPDSVLVCVVGRGYATAGRLNSPFNLASPTPLLYGDGDETVAREDARLRNASLEVFSNHTNLVNTPIVLGSLTDLLVNGLPPEPPILVIPGGFTVPGPVGPEGPLTTQRIIEVFDFEAASGSRRSPSGAEPRPAYCP